MHQNLTHIIFIQDKSGIGFSQSHRSKLYAVFIQNWLKI
jgi:hypothetical protein